MRRAQRDTSVMSQRDLQWIAEANAWAKSMTNQYFESHRTGLHTVADVLQWLDGRDDQPTAWTRWLSDYQTRYQMVRNACMSFARDGYLEPGSTVNAKGREAVCYTYTGASEPWAIHVVPADQTDRVSGLVRGWLHTHRTELHGVEAITVTLRKHRTKHDHGEGEAAASSGRNQLRKRAS